MEVPRNRRTFLPKRIRGTLIGSSSASCSSTGARATGPKERSAGTPSKEPWHTAIYPVEKMAAELEGTDPIHKISTRTARLSIACAYLATKALWLVPGRPGYMVIKEDSKGQKEDWKDPYCLLCGTYVTEDHIETSKHTGKMTTATHWLLSKGWGQIIAWLEQDKREVINVIRDPPADQLRRSPESSDDHGATGSGELTGPLMPGLNFANWPFRDLEVNLSSKKKPGEWTRKWP